MKIVNLRDYLDKETKTRQKTGAIREVAARRGREIIAKGCAEEVKEPDGAPEPAE